jgi:pimeloyl-ACP methyl ester carboxylesterase
MQGKFQMVLLPHGGHSVQEDFPDKLTAQLLRFSARLRAVSDGNAFVPQAQ